MVFFWYDKGVRSPIEIPSDSAQRRVQPLNPIRRSSQVDSEPSPQEQDSFAKHSEAQDAYEKMMDSTETTRPAVLASEIASSPAITMSAEQTLAEALTFFRKRGFRNVPVKDSHGALVGMLSDREVLTEIVRDPVEGPKMAIKDVMSRPVLTARPQAPMKQLAGTMFEHGVDAMPIVDDEGELFGIVTRSDILKALVERAPVEIWI